MELKKTLLKTALSCALVLSLAGVAEAGPEYKDGVIFCKVQLTPMADVNDPNSDIFLSVTLPATEGYSYRTDGTHQATIWNLGTVSCGGVYDSFYNGGPGYFRVQNTGNYPAYVYVSTGTNDCAELGRDDYIGCDEYQWCIYDLFGDDCQLSLPVMPSPRLVEDNMGYALAVSTDVTSLVPKWKPLSWCFGEFGRLEYNYNYYNNDYYIWYSQYQGSSYIDCSAATRVICHGGSVYIESDNNMFRIQSDPCAYLAYMPIGETQLFDLKFWAPTWCGDTDRPWFFIVRVEASAFRRWDHEK